ncbi:MAG: NAD(P) transhydrogenase subunit alpha [Spirochaetaceae bacterium]|nr:NAD(P) transhydrogenase subunit alpha [Spirochaetaceae bacterium]
MGIISLLFVFVMAAFLGLELIAKVPSQLHTPLMSATNAISGIILIGAVSITAGQTFGSLGMWLGLLGIFLATINVVGGFLVTARMLEMFKDKGGKK